MKYIKKYEIALELIDKLSPEDTKQLIIFALRDYFLEGQIKKIQRVEMTNEEIADWEDLDEEGG